MALLHFTPSKAKLARGDGGVPMAPSSSSNQETRSNCTSVRDAQADALLVVPPLLKVVSGPLLGPAMLAGAARAAGHRVRVVDLNARWLRERLGDQALLQTSPFVGDHDRPSLLLSSAQKQFATALASAMPEADPCLDEDPALTLTYEHDDVLSGAHRLADGQLGSWMRAQLHAVRPPSVVGVSVMYSGQVLAALALSIVARRTWPRSLIVWGGAHVTALRHEIVADARYGECVDRFVFGYAERTWVDLLDAVEGGARLPAAAIVAGSGCDEGAHDDADTAPSFDDLETYGWGRLTLPAQASRGCAYGRCTFCTYPAVEGRYRALELDASLAVVAAAERIGGAVSFKDSLVLPRRLEAIASAIGGRVPWSACTKLHEAYDAALLRRIADGGCATLELGLETLTATSQRLIEKKQPFPLFLRTLDAASEAGIAVVVNYITGFPGSDRDEEAHALARVHDALANRPSLVAKIEHNGFQLERMSPMGRRPEAFGLRVTQTWPWSSVMAWVSVPGATERSAASDVSLVALRRSTKRT